jgi:hypothetical protein
VIQWHGSGGQQNSNSVISIFKQHWNAVHPYDSNQKFNKMRNKLTIALLFCFCAVAVAQETKFYKKSIDVDSILSIRGAGLREYLAKNLKYPPDAASNGIMGTSIGGIRLDKNGNLIKVFTVNSLCKTIDDGFIEIIKKIWKKKEVVVSNVSDTTDVFMAIQYKILDETLAKPYEYYVDLIPKFVSDGVGIVSYAQIMVTRVTTVSGSISTVSGSPNLRAPVSGPTTTISGSPGLTTSVSPPITTISSPNSTKFIDDTELVDKANENFKNRKFDKCIKPLNELIRRNPYNADIILMRGVCYNKLQKYDLENRDYNYLRFFLENDKYKKLRITE